MRLLIFVLLSAFVAYATFRRIDVTPNRYRIPPPKVWRKPPEPKRKDE